MKPKIITMSNIANDLATPTEIKKLVYKQKPKAYFQKIRIGVAYYNFDVLFNDSVRLQYRFEIPVSDMGEADFYQEMEAKLLLRWLDTTALGFISVKQEL